MKSGKPIIAVYDTKPYDRDFLTRATGADELAFSRFLNGARNRLRRQWDAGGLRICQ